MDRYAYLGLSKPKRFLFKAKLFFRNVPNKIKTFFKKVPSKFIKIGKKVSSPFVEMKDALVYGDYKTRLSFLFMGFGLFTRKEYLKGILFFLFEVIFGLFIGLWGWKYLSKFGTLGTQTGSEIWNEATQSYITIKGDNSLLILLYGTVCLIVIFGFIYTYFQNIRSSYRLQQISNVGCKIPNTKETLSSLADREYHKTLLAIPMLGLVVFTIIPLIFMIFIAFTNWEKATQPPEHLFTWVGFENFDTLLGGSGMGQNAKFAYTFRDALLWTLVWAFFATFSNYFLGMILALVINKKGIKFKKLWRTILITTIAVPQFVSLLLISQMFSSGGIFNHLLSLMGLPKLVYSINSTWARIFVILINVWVGVPYTVLSCTGILMNIPNDLYESARIDGASPFKTYMNITLPYMMFVMGPYLISQFVGNINNFNVIFLLTGGVPVNSDKFIGGDTDLLITWLYKLTVNENNYKMASSIGILVFIIVAVISLIFYSKSNSVKNEEDFQ
mgnify:CR=1 FL=1